MPWVGPNRVRHIWPYIWWDFYTNHKTTVYTPYICLANPTNTVLRSCPGPNSPFYHGAYCHAHVIRHRHFMRHMSMHTLVCICAIKQCAIDRLHSVGMSVYTVCVCAFTQCAYEHSHSVYMRNYAMCMWPHSVRMSIHTVWVWVFTQ
jgi:hypothetical protein